MRHISCLSVFTVALAVLASPPAAAAASEPASAPELNAASTPVGGGDQAALVDPHQDRGLISPTGQTQPGGTISVSLHEAMVLGVTAGLHDRLQLSATTLIPAGGQLGMVSFKWQALRTSRLRLAVVGGIGYSTFRLWSLGDDSDDDGSVTPLGGAVASLCLDHGCHSLVSAGAYLLGRHNPTVIGTGSLIVRVVDQAKIVFEYTGQGFAAGGSGWNTFGAAFRVAGRRMALDLGGLAFVDSNLNALPYLSVTYRF